MFDRFTDRARKTMGLARQAALRHDHDYIGPEHMLLGLLAEGCGVAASVAKNLGVDLQALHRSVEARMERGNTPGVEGQIPFTPESKAALQSCLEEARGLGHTYLGTEHLLLGLLSLPDGFVAKALLDAGLQPERVRAEVRELLGAPLVEDRSGPAQLFLGMLEDEDGVVVRALRSLDVDLDRLREAVRWRMGEDA